MKSFFADVMKGLPGTFLVLTIILRGDPVSAGLFFAASIICTAGISLVVWIPVLWLAGIITDWLFRLIIGREKSDEPLRVRRPKLGSDWISLERFLKKVDSQGGSWESAKAALQRAGWEEDEIEKVMDRLRREGDFSSNSDELQ